MSTIAEMIAQAERFPLKEPIEIHLMTKWVDRASDEFVPADRQNRWVLALWVDGHGIIRDSLSNGRGGSTYTLAKIQMKEQMPKKAVPGWQLKAIEAAMSGLYEVYEVR